ncbi:MAG TPA: hypothetical protein VF486_11945 [Actinomycetes bacterium]
MTADPIAAWHDLLESDAALAEASCAALTEGQRERSLFFGEHPLSVSLRPQLVTRERYQRAVAAAEAVHGALAALERVLLADADLRAELDLAPGEEALAMAEPGFGSSSSSSRLDSFFADEIRYVEYNAESPAGMAYTDVLAEVFESMPVMREFRKRWRLTPLNVRDQQLGCMLRAFDEWRGGRSERPAIAIVDWPGLPTLTEFEMFRAFFEASGVPTHICDPAGLEFSGGVLRADGQPVNLVYRRVLTSELLATEDDSHHALRDAYLAGAACVVNSFRAKLLHKKMSLALLSDERYASLYTPTQREAIERHVPWTRRVREGPTTRHGHQIDDLAAYVCQRPRELVLKPNDEYGGKGVVLGWTVDVHEWEQAVAVALTQSYVVQEAVPVPREPFPVALDGLKLLEFSVDMDPYLFDGQVAGTLTRLSSSALLNVTAGAGSVVPAYVVEGSA